MRFPESLLESTGRYSGREFEPTWYYNAEGDCIETIWEKGEYYAVRVNNAITLYKERESDRVVGAMLKNVAFGLEGADAGLFHRGD